ncbi:colanic acid biosynthesis glycosyltransferase WcaL [Xylanimonas oleitrophica]|uniref:Colanic acid biosynthesis glycosyltransferase WcaL n=2 Tax=Xylanimonas oleitrophica TaxID=2607479 RepID=A0A2W5WWL0_9MICO|nr:colanic acid biosynthesis glycosyltransferase WcaL [Xylanimonas oleitrophica]
MYPRFSETFVVTELLSMQRLGVDLEVFSLRYPVDGRFHPSLAEMRAPVTYLKHGGLRAADVWAALGAARAAVPEVDAHLDELLAAEVGDAVQALELAVAVRERGITHLHAHFASVATTVARLAALLTGITYSVTAHAKDIFHEEVDPADLRRKVADARAVVTVSDYNLAHLRAELGPDAGRVRRVYNGLDLRGFPYADPGDRPPVVAAVGRLVEKKGFADLLEAVAVLVGSGRKVEVELVGAGPLADDLRARRDRLGLADVVHLRGPLPQDEVSRVVAGAACFAAPCVVGADGNRDGLPTVLLEAMALGTPVVSTPVTGIPEVVHDDATGLLVPERDPQALAVALGRLLDDALLRRRLAAAARELVETEFDTTRQAARVAETFA